MSSVVLLLSGILTDSVTDPARKNALILTMRYIAFAMVLVDVAISAVVLLAVNLLERKPKGGRP